MNAPKESNDLLLKLTERLPELEWRISKLGVSFSSKNLPKGLFRFSKELNGSACITEIKEEIQRLSNEKNKLSAFYLAERISQKINVLVILCKMHQQKNKQEEKVHFGINKLRSRQQWINDLQREIDTLTEQQQAMIKTLHEMKGRPDSSMVLHLKAELGELERRLTLAKESLVRHFL